MMYDFELEGAPYPNSDVQYEKQVIVEVNYFNFIELLTKLKEQEIWAIGTLRADRMRQCKLNTEKELKKEGRGSFDGAIDLYSGVSIVRWYDKQVQLASNFTHIEPVGTVTRWSKKDNKMIEISRQCIADAYNKSMSGVDLFDMFRSLYHMNHMSNRWYIRIFFWILSSSIINGWVLHKKHCNVLGITKKNQLTLIQFTAEVSDGLIKNAILQPRCSGGRPRLNTSVFSEFDTSLSPKRRRRAPDLQKVAQDIRYDKSEHWPIHREDRPRCFLCKEKCRIG